MAGTRAFAILNGFMGVVIAACGVLQLNDPDPMYWVIFYALGAMACLLFHLKRLPPSAAGVYAVLCGVLALVWGILQLTGRVLPGSIPDMAYEGEKEIAGFLMVGAWMAVLYFRAKRMGME